MRLSVSSYEVLKQSELVLFRRPVLYMLFTCSQTMSVQYWWVKSWIFFLQTQIVFRLFWTLAVNMQHLGHKFLRMLTIHQRFTSCSTFWTTCLASKTVFLIEFDLFGHLYLGLHWFGNFYSMQSHRRSFRVTTRRKSKKYHKISDFETFFSIFHSYLCFSGPRAVRKGAPFIFSDAKFIGRMLLFFSY